MPPALVTAPVPPVKSAPTAPPLIVPPLLLVNAPPAPRLTPTPFAPALLIVPPLWLTTVPPDFEPTPTPDDPVAVIVAELVIVPPTAIPTPSL